MGKDGFTSLERLKHVSLAVDHILQYCKGKSETDFLADHLLSSAVLYQFLVIGEAIQFIDNDILNEYPYPWHLPRSFRNYIAHEYFGINLKQVYKTATIILPEFKLLVDTMIANIRE